MDDDAEFVAILGEPPRDFDQHALLDVVQDFLVARFVTDQQQTQAVGFQHFERFARHVRLGVAGPGDAELAEFLRQSLDARQIVGQRVVVEEDLLDRRKGLARVFDLGDHMFDRAHAIIVAADRLRPKAERAARFAAAPRVKREVGVLEIAAEIAVDVEVALVDRRHERQEVHIGQDLAILVVNDRAFGVAVGNALDLRPVQAFGDVLDREVEFVAGDEIERVRRFEALFRLDRDFGADEADLAGRIDRLDHLGRFDVGFERRRRSMHDDEFVAPSSRA